MKNKKFTISNEDLQGLQYRRRIINEHEFIVSVLKQGLDLFVDLHLKHKLGIKPEQAVQIDYNTGILEVIDIKSEEKK